MNRRTRNDWQKTLEALLRSAVRTLRIMPRTGCLPGGYKSCMPTPVRSTDDWWWADRTIGYGSEAARKRLKEEMNRVQSNVVSARALSNLDDVLAAMSGAKMSALQRNLIWDRAANVGWKQIEQKYRLPPPERGPSIATLKRHHHKGMVEIVLYVIEKQQDRLSQKSVSHFRRIAA